MGYISTHEKKAVVFNTGIVCPETHFSIFTSYFMTGMN